MMATTRKSILLLFLINVLCNTASFSDAWVASPLPSHRRGDIENAQEPRDFKDHDDLACLIDASDETIIFGSQSRRSVFRQLGSCLVPAVTLLASPVPVIATDPADIDPFAAMHDILSSSGATTTNGLPATLSSPDDPAAKTFEPRGTAGGGSVREVPSSSNDPRHILQSDMAAALQESKKRRTIDPRTHG